MNIIVVGLSHKTAPVEIREKLAVPESRMGQALTRLSGYPGITESFLLSTCNRVEVYAVVEEAEVGQVRVQGFLADTHLSLSSEQLTPHLYRYTDERAIEHLFRVASSLDSMIVGEPQILGQLKDAYELSLTHKSSGVILNKVVKKALSVAKRVRSETKIAETAVSVSYAAVELAKKIFSSLSEKTILLVGAGEMAKLAARHLINSGVRRVMITTRDTHSAVELAKQFEGTPIPFEDLRREMAEADIVLCSTGASQYLITAEDVQRAVRQRMNRPIFLIDISVPRNIDPAAKDIDNAFLFDIDDLELRVEQNREERRREAAKAEQMVEEEVAVILQWLKSLEVTPTIVALRKRAEDIKQTELNKTIARLTDLSDPQRQAIETLASAITNKLLHGSLVTLKAEADSANGALFVEAARRFFNLDQESLASRGETGDRLVPTVGRRSEVECGRPKGDVAPPSSEEET
ncbi:MAG TPA: glutamyl-tRNA reductase [Nitrospiraceae bacterium]|jgi:glutamyl-tRNA reductase|nr:glutamyl-tRNA reductase [Nitrospiraceae bacterium]